MFRSQNQLVDWGASHRHLQNQAVFSHVTAASQSGLYAATERSATVNTEQ